MRLLSDESVERSAAVTNCWINRERNLVGSNGYNRELGLNPPGFSKGPVFDYLTAWLGLYCGMGRTLMETARVVQTGCLAPKIEIVSADEVAEEDQRSEP